MRPGDKAAGRGSRPLRERELCSLTSFFPFAHLGCTPHALVRARAGHKALQVFSHALAVSQQQHSSTELSRAAIVHNIGYCLHAQGEFEAARTYYEQALDAFRSGANWLVNTSQITTDALPPESNGTGYEAYAGHSRGAFRRAEAADWARVA